MEICMDHTNCVFLGIPAGAKENSDIYTVTPSLASSIITRWVHANETSRVGENPLPFRPITLQYNYYSPEEWAVGSALCQIIWPEWWRKWEGSMMGLGVHYYSIVLFDKLRRNHIPNDGSSCRTIAVISASKYMCWLLPIILEFSSQKQHPHLESESVRRENFPKKWYT